MIYCFEKTAGFTFFAADPSFEDNPLKLLHGLVTYRQFSSEGFMIRKLYMRNTLLRTGAAATLYCFDKTAGLTFFAVDAIFENSPLELLYGPVTYR